MKKIISLTLVFSFIFVLAVQIPVLAEDNTSSVSILNSDNLGATSTDKNLIKIPSPEYIKYFEKIIKIGNTLFGIKKNTDSVKPELKKSETAKNEKLEKISSPEHISLFEKITKIGNDLFGIRKLEKNKATSTSENKNIENKNYNLEKIISLDQVKFFEKITKIGNDLFGLRKEGNYILPVMSAELVACVSTAIDVKDSKISENLTKTVTEISSAITARGICQKAALALTSERQGAINTCNKNFQKTNKQIQETTSNAQKQIWTIYRSSLKTCATNANSTEIKIEDGGQNDLEVLNQ